MGIVTGYLSQLVSSGIKLLVGGSAVSSSNPLPTTAGNFAYTKDNTGATSLTASWALVKTTTTATLSTIVDRQHCNRESLCRF